MFLLIELFSGFCCDDGGLPFWQLLRGTWLHSFAILAFCLIVCRRGELWLRFSLQVLTLVFACSVWRTFSCACCLIPSSGSWTRLHFFRVGQPPSVISSPGLQWWIKFSRQLQISASFLEWVPGETSQNWRLSVDNLVSLSYKWSYLAELFLARLILCYIS